MGRISCRRSTAVVLALGLALGATRVEAQTWRMEPSISLTETLTNNVNLSASSDRQGDLISQLTPTLKFSEIGARSKLDGTIALPIVLYARTGSENNNVYPTANVLGTVAAVERLLFIEGFVSVSQPFLSPFGAQPSGLTSATDNRYTQSTYRVSPYIKGESPGSVEFELRNNSSWTNLNGAPINTSNSYTSEWLGKVQGPAAPLRWFGDFDFVDVNFQNQAPQRTNLARGGLRYLVSPQFRVQLAAGYEDNHYPFSDFRGAIYGGGIEWRPTERTSVSANVEHRFFGTSYLLSIAHRTPLSVWSVAASRNITTYPQQLGTLTPGANVQGLLDQLLSSRIPDPAQRQQAVQDLIQQTGLPSTVSGPVNVYSEEILLAENFNATAGLTGARNDLFLNVFRLRNEPITASGTALPSLLDANNNNTQLGANLTWTHRLTPMAALNLTAFVSRTTANAPLTGRTNQGGALLQLSSPLSAHTTATAGIRFQKLNSDIVQSYTEAAVLAGLTYSFK